MHSAALAFYALVSLVPLGIAVVWAASLIAGDTRVREFTDQSVQLMPRGLGVTDAVQRVADLGTRIGIVALVTGLWPASAYGSGLARSFRSLGSSKSEKLSGLRGRALVLVALLPVLAFGGILASLFGTAVLGNGAIRGPLGYVLAFVMGFVISSAGAALAYVLFAPERLSWPALWRGTVLAASGGSVLALAFTIFLRIGADFEKHYATSGVAGLVLMGLFLFGSNAMLLLGYQAACHLDGRH